MEKHDSSSKSSKLALVLAAVLIVIGIGVAVYALNSPVDETDETSQRTATSSSTTPKESNNDGATQDVADNTAQNTVITFTDDGFDKDTYTSKTGEAVTVKNESSMDVQFSSDDHPSHRENPELNLEVLSPGESATFTPPGAGSYGFHDHIDDRFTGTLIVQ